MCRVQFGKNETQLVLGPCPKKVYVPRIRRFSSRGEELNPQKISLICLIFCCGCLGDRFEHNVPVADFDSTNSNSKSLNQYKQGDSDIENSSNAQTQDSDNRSTLPRRGMNTLPKRRASTIPRRGQSTLPRRGQSTLPRRGQSTVPRREHSTLPNRRQSTLPRR